MTASALVHQLIISTHVLHDALLKTFIIIKEELSELLSYILMKLNK